MSPVSWIMQSKSSGALTFENFFVTCKKRIRIPLDAHLFFCMWHKSRSLYNLNITCVRCKKCIFFKKKNRSLYNLNITLHIFVSDAKTKMRIFFFACDTQILKSECPARFTLHDSRYRRLLRMFGRLWSRVRRLLRILCEGLGIIMFERIGRTFCFEDFWELCLKDFWEFCVKDLGDFFFFRILKSRSNILGRILFERLLRILFERIGRIFFLKTFDDNVWKAFEIFLFNRLLRIFEKTFEDVCVSLRMCVCLWGLFWH
jgi:hypothetical protein